MKILQLSSEKSGYATQTLHIFH